MNAKYQEKVKEAKHNYKEQIVGDLKSSKPGQWYSKVKCMTTMKKEADNEPELDEFTGLQPIEEANKFLSFYATTRGSFQPIDSARFSHLLHDAQENVHQVLTTPLKICEVIKHMNQKSASVHGDIPFKLFSYFRNDISLPCVI